MAKGYLASSSASSMSGLSKRTRQILFVCVILTLAVFFLPFGRIVGYPLILVSTFAHEMGHGLTALIMGANFASFQMWSDGSGVANIEGQGSAIGSALTAAGGLVGPSVFAALSFVAAKKAAISRIFLSLVGVGMIVAEFLYVRNMFAWVFVGVLAAIFLWLAQQSRAWLAQAFLVFLGIELSLSVFSRSDYLFTETAVTSQGIMPSDVAVIAQALILPYWFWGAACGVFSIIVLLLGLWSYLRK
jgi:hypothetical protein